VKFPWDDPFQAAKYVGYIQMGYKIFFAMFDQ